MKEKFNVSGMTCAACSNHVENAVKKLEGVNSVNVNLLQNSMSVDFNENKLSKNEIVAAVEKAGYAAVENNSQKKQSDAFLDIYKEDAKKIKKRLIHSAILLIPLLYISMGHMFGMPLPNFLTGINNSFYYAFVQFVLTTFIIIINRNYFKNGFKSLVNKNPTMDSLIAIGSSAAFIYGIYAMWKIFYGIAVNNIELVSAYHSDLYFESAATILTLITVGKYFESRSKSKTNSAVAGLLGLVPKTVLIEKNNEIVEIPQEEVKVGDIIIIKTGNVIPVDGIITEGNAYIDESAITGESLPVKKEVNDNVTGATSVKSGYFKFKALKVGKDTVLSQIVKLVEEAGASKAPIARIADKVSYYFVPIVISIAVIAVVVWLINGTTFEFALSIGISVLIISCPCAIGLATPTAIMVAMGKGAQIGILFKDAESLETAHNINSIILDKTGTVTQGKPAVVNSIAAVNVDEKEFFSNAAAIESLSEHPYAKAVMDKVNSKNIDYQKAEKFIQVEGRGLKAFLNNNELLAGNRQLMIDEGINSKDLTNLENLVSYEEKTPLFFAKNKQLLGVLEIADAVKESSINAVKQMKERNIQVTLLTGDNKKTAESVAKQINADKFIAEVLPQDKEKIVRDEIAGGSKVAMVGDGINDAPALISADLGIAVASGTEVAIESADIILMKNNLMQIVTAMDLSKATIKNIKQNLFWAFFYNILGIPLAAGVFYSVLGWKLSPMFAAAAMSCSSIFVVTNALRLRFFKVKTVSKGERKVIKKIKIEGMSCARCKNHVEEALNAIDGVYAVVDLDSKTATVNLSKDIQDDVLRSTIENGGYRVISIE